MTARGSRALSSHSPLPGGAEGAAEAAWPLPLGGHRSGPKRSPWAALLGSARRPRSPARGRTRGAADLPGGGVPAAWAAARTFLSVCLWGAREAAGGAAPGRRACRGALARGPPRLRSAPQHGRPVGAGGARSRRCGGHGCGDPARACGKAVPVRGGRRGRASRARAERLRARLAGGGHPSRVPPRPRPPGLGGENWRASRPSARGGWAAQPGGAGGQAGARQVGRAGGPRGALPGPRLCALPGRPILYLTF